MVAAMDDVGKAISFIVGVGFLLASIGTLGEITDALRPNAAKACRRGIFNITSFNQKLVNPGHSNNVVVSEPQRSRRVKGK